MANRTEKIIALARNDINKEFSLPSKKYSTRNKLVSSSKMKKIASKNTSNIVPGTTMKPKIIHEQSIASTSYGEHSVKPNMLETSSPLSLPALSTVTSDILEKSGINIEKIALPSEVIVEESKVGKIIASTSHQDYYVKPNRPETSVLLLSIPAFSTISSDISDQSGIIIEEIAPTSEVYNVPEAIIKPVLQSEVIFEQPKEIASTSQDYYSNPDRLGTSVQLSTTAFYASSKSSLTEKIALPSEDLHDAVMVNIAENNIKPLPELSFGEIFEQLHVVEKIETISLAHPENCIAANSHIEPLKQISRMLSPAIIKQSKFGLQENAQVSEVLGKSILLDVSAIPMLPANQSLTELPLAVIPGQLEVIEEIDPTFQQNNIMPTMTKISLQPSTQTLPILAPDIVQQAGVSIEDIVAFQKNSITSNPLNITTRPSKIDLQMASSSRQDNSIMPNDDPNYEEPFQDSGSSYRPSTDLDESEPAEKQAKKKSRLRKSKNNDQHADNMINEEKEPQQKILEGATGHDNERQKRKTAKKGQSKPEEWQRNKNQLLRMKGQEYEGIAKQFNKPKSKVRRSSRKLKDRCDSNKCLKSKAKRQCLSITEAQRSDLFQTFWSEMSWQQRKTFVTTLVSKRPTAKKTKANRSRRNLSLFYHLKINNILVPVCKKMFLSTLGLGEWSVLNWVKLSDHSGITPLQRKFAAKIKPINNEKRLKIREFLDRLPKMPSHYCRSTSSKLYLENVFRSYVEVFELYKKEVGQDMATGREVFVAEMKNLNIDIFQPRKDQCDLCFAYKQGNVDLERYQSHINSKDRARQEKHKDKTAAIAGKICVFTMDVQAVQLVPYLPAGMIYFKQKLACHNFTVYNLANDKVVCYIWHEGEGGMDGNCFASCLTDFLDHEIDDQDKRKTKIFYSDGCSAQNRNTTLSNSLLDHCKREKTIIIQKYLVKGHSQMECDSVHSTIEKRKKHKEMHSPSAYVQIIQDARTNSKGAYKVKYVSYDFFNDYSNLKYYTSIRPGNKAGDACVTDVRALKYSFDSGIEYKLDQEDQWTMLPRRMSTNPGSITKLYTSPLPIKGDKYEHLQSLKSVIHKDYHGFYDSLHH